MSAGLALRVGLALQPTLTLYSKLLPLGIEELSDVVDLEVAENPWLSRERPVSDSVVLDTLANLASRPSLADRLLAQIEATTCTPAQLRVAEFIVGSLDADGYLHESLDAIARASRASPADAHIGLASVQACEPIGVAARSLGERFQLQLRDRNVGDPCTHQLCEHLEELASGGAALVAKVLDRSALEVQAALRTLRTLDPHPTRDFSMSVDYVYPEVIFDRDARSGEWAARIDDRLWPKVRYDSIATSRGLSPAMRDARTRAHHFVDALARRKQTLQRIADAILREQCPFFESTGDQERLRPLRGRDLAACVGCAESTVSRALSSRYARTPFGVLPLRALLAERSGKQAITRSSVMRRIGELIARSSKPPSDSQLERALALGGIRIARRTVAKYRKALALPSSRGSREDGLS